MTTRRQVEAALKAEARKLNEANRGTHVFDPIQRTLGTRCNWTATYRATGSKVPLDELEAALERVQEMFPMVEWPKR
jgi:hypothetical protein